MCPLWPTIHLAEKMGTRLAAGALLFKTLSIKPYSKILMRDHAPQHQFQNIAKM